MNELLIVLKEVLKEKELREKNNNYEYTKEDLLALKEWLDTGEITLYDLTTNEYRLLNVSFLEKNKLERRIMPYIFPSLLAQKEIDKKVTAQGDNISTRLIVQYADEAILKYGEDIKSKNKHLKRVKERQTK